MVSFLTCRPGCENIFKYARIINPAVRNKAHSVLGLRFESINDVESLRGV